MEYHVQIVVIDENGHKVATRVITKGALSTIAYRLQRLSTVVSPVLPEEGKIAIQEVAKEVELFAKWKKQGMVKDA